MRARVWTRRWREFDGCPFLSVVRSLGSRAGVDRAPLHKLEGRTPDRWSLVPRICHCSLVDWFGTARIHIIHFFLVLAGLFRRVRGDVVPAHFREGNAVA